MIPEQTAAALPHTTTWLADAAAARPGVASPTLEREPLPSKNHTMHAVAEHGNGSSDSSAAARPGAAATSHPGVPASMRTGGRTLGRDSTARPGAARARSAGAPPPLVVPVEASTWRGMVRRGIVTLVCGEAPADGSAGETPWSAGFRMHLSEHSWSHPGVQNTILLQI